PALLLGRGLSGGLACSLAGRGLLGLVDQHHRDAVAHGVAVPAGPAHEDLGVLLVVELAPVVGAHQDLEQLGVECHVGPPSRRISSRSSEVFSSSRSLVLASTFSRRSGSVLLGRTLNHQSSNSTVSPSVRSGRPSRYAAASSSFLASWPSPRELIPPESW